jgi:MerR family redox-sensitive transcriptional activator SoxR
MATMTNVTSMTAPSRGVKIGELARRLGLTARALRYWEERHLIPPARRSSGGTRLYAEETARCVRGIQRLKRAGFSLDDIENLQVGMAEASSPRLAMGGLGLALVKRERELRERIREHQLLIAELESARRSLEGCERCDRQEFGSECVDCLSQRIGRSLPDCLHGVLEGAAVPRLPSPDPSSS